MPTAWANSTIDVGSSCMSVVEVSVVVEDEFAVAVSRSRGGLQIGEAASVFERYFRAVLKDTAAKVFCEPALTSDGHYRVAV